MSVYEDPSRSVNLGRVDMNYDLIGILLLGVAELVTFEITLRVVRQMEREMNPHQARHCWTDRSRVREDSAASPGVGPKSSFAKVGMNPCLFLYSEVPQALVSKIHGATRRRRASGRLALSRAGGVT